MKKLHQQLYVQGQLAIDDFAKLAEAGIKTIINNRPDDEEMGQLNHETASQLAAEHGIAYHYLPMANGQGLPPTLINDFKAAIENSEQPILAHCRSGMRSSFLWAMGQIADGAITPDQAIQAATNAGIPLSNARAVLESAVES